MAIGAAGIGSGLDIDGFVAKLLSVERAPVENRLNRREAALQVELTAFGTLKGSLAAFQGQTEALQDVGIFTGRNAASSDSDVLGVSATDAAATGTYDISVTTLAKSHKLASGSFAAADTVIGTGELTIDFGNWDVGETTFTADTSKTGVTLDIDATNNTVEGVAEAINDADIGVRASVINDGSGYRIALVSEATGTSNSIAISIVDDDTIHTDNSGISQLLFNNTAKQITTTQTAVDAAFSVDGIDVTRDSNSVSDVLDGVTLTLESAGTSQVTIELNKAQAHGAIEQFVDAYNGLARELANLSSYEPVSGVAGALQGNSLVRGLQTQLRRLVSDASSGGGSLQTLADMGITTTRDGTLEIDGETLDAALDENMDGVMNVLANTDDSIGVAGQFDAYLEALLESDAPIPSRSTTINESLSDIADERADLARRLEQIETRLLKQFGALDAIIAELQTTGDFLTQQIAALPSNSKK